MPELSNAVWLYFTPCEETFWKWSADQQAVEWRGGLTIAFRYELQTLLEHLVAEGLPPFETILLTVAACRNRGEAAIRELPRMLLFNEYAMGFSMRKTAHAVWERLDLLTKLPEDLRTSIDGKRAILSLISENGPLRKKAAFGQDCFNWLRQGYDIKDSPAPTPYIKPTNEWITELRGLHDGLAAVNETAVRLRMKTGFETLPSPAPIPLELPPPDPEPVPLTVRELLHELEQDEEHAGLVRLTRRLLSIVALPRPVSSPDDQPLGGVSDITNRGPFDRLLLSELAQDSDVLMTRVALNEAMYIRREVPPAFPPRERLILVDAGIRMWGLPRLYATAAALALAMMQDEKATTRMFRPTSHGVTSVDLTVREGLVEHLGNLELPVHPGESLPAFLAEANDALTDYVLITSEDVLCDPEFRQYLAHQQFTNLYVVAVTREGDLRLLQRSRQGERVLRQAKLDLNQILAEEPKIKPKTKLRDESVDPRLPAICRVRPFPLFLYHQMDWENCGGCQDRETEKMIVDGVLAVTHDRRLMLWHPDYGGAIQYSDRLPAGKLLWYESFLAPRGTCHAVIGSVEQRRLYKVTATPEQDEIKVLEIPNDPPLRGICEHAGVLYVVLKHKTVLFSRESGETLTVVDHPPDVLWVRGRFFRKTSVAFSYRALTYDGQAAHWIEVAQDTEQVAVLTMLDCQCLVAPIVVYADRTVWVTGSTEILKFRSTFHSNPQSSIEDWHIGGGKLMEDMHVSACSHNGNRFVLSDVAGQLTGQRQCWLVDMQTRTARESLGWPHTILHSKAFSIPKRKSLRSRFIMAGVHKGQLTLMTAKQRFVSFCLDQNPDRIRLQHLEIPRSSFGSEAGFRPIPPPPGVGYELKVAEWRNGSRAILDSRGLLHLQNGDDNIPEMTLVLYDANVAGWCDQNLVWGDPELTGRYVDHMRISPERVFNDWLVHFCRRLTFCRG